MLSKLLYNHVRSWCFQENKLFPSCEQASLSLGCLHHFNTLEAESVHAWQHSSLILCRYKLARSLTIALIYMNINLSS